MTELLAIILGGLAMSAVALVGLVTTVRSRRAFDAVIVPLVALAAGSLLGGALFHMLPKSAEHLGNDVHTYGLVVLGVLGFLILEQFLHWHHCHRSACGHLEDSGPDRERRPVGYLVLWADGLHNLLGGLAVGAAFVLDLRVGIVAWLVAAAHEVLQKLGDFGLLVHSGWSRRRALAFNVLSAATFLLGGLLAWAFSGRLDVTFLVPFAAGNLIYIAMVDLIPQLTAHRSVHSKAVTTATFAAGLLAMYATAVVAS